MEILFSGLLAAVVIIMGNSYIQKNLRNLQLRDELKRRFFDYLALASDYWLAGDTEDFDKRNQLEAKIIATQMIILADYRAIKMHNKSMEKSYKESKTYRQNLWDHVTGGCFQQQKSWSRDNTRFINASNEVANIIRTFR